MLRLVAIALTMGSFSTSIHSSREWLRPLLSGAPRPMVMAGMPRLIGMLESVELQP